MQEMQAQSLGQEDPLEEEMATHFCTLAWDIPWTAEPGALQSMGSQSQTRLSEHTHTACFQMDGTGGSEGKGAPV